MANGSIPAEWKAAIQSLTGDRYELDVELGSGGMATVYRARDKELKRSVAIKILHRHLIGNAEHDARFRREAESIARLDHPGIVEIYDLLEVPGEFLAIVMEYVPGESLAALLDESLPLPPELAAQIMLPVLHALSYAHKQGVIHRDLKPANILVDDDAVPRLSDFGIAHIEAEETLTTTGSIVGSPAFMAPEVAEGQPADERSDLFAVGSILFLMVTGEMPFSGHSPPELLRNIADGRRKRADVVRETVGRHFADILEVFLSTDPDERPSTASEIAEILSEFSSASPVFEPPDPNLWLKEPKSYTLEVQREIEAGLRKKARRAVELQDFPGALAAVERLLSITPGDSEATELLDRLHSDDSRRPIVIAAGIIAAIFALGAVGFFAYSPASQDDPVSSKSISAPEHSALPGAGERVLDYVETYSRFTSRLSAIEAALDTADTAEFGAGEMDSDSRSAARQDDMPATPDAGLPDDAGDATETPPPNAEDDVAAQETETIRFRLIPTSAILHVDGREFDAMEAARGVELSHGDVEIAIRAPGCETHREVVSVGPDSSDDYSVVLSWQDGYIRLAVDRDSLVWVDGDNTPQRVSAAQENLLTVEFGPADEVANKREVALRVAPRDDLERARTTTASVRPGTETPIAVSLHEER